MDLSLQKEHEIVCALEPQVTGDLWSWSWKTKSVLKIRFFIWECCHGKIASAALLHHKAMTIYATATAYSMETEDANHILNKCPFAQSFWRELGNPMPKAAPFSLPIQERLRANCLAYERHGSDLRWHIIFPQALWMLPKWRNERLFRGCNGHTVWV